MSVIITGQTNITAYTNNIRPEAFLSTYYAITGNPVYVQYKIPNQYTGFGNVFLSGYFVDFADGSSFVFANPNDSIYHTYNNYGTYYISFSGIYSDGTIITKTITNPFIIKDKFEIYNQENFRLVDEKILNLPYTLDQVEIQPNEWGVEDIFNTAIGRIQENLDYLKYNSQTINTHSPTIFFGWLGSNSSSKASGIKWYTQDYNYEYVNNPELAVASGGSFFTNIKDAQEIHDDYIYLIDNNNFRVFSAGAIPKEINFTNAFNISQLLINPISFDIDDTGDYIYLVDNAASKVYKFNIDLSPNNPSLNLELYVGGYGKLTDHNKFNTPTEINYASGYVFVLDYNNQCIKEYNSDLNWIHTYEPDLFGNEQPVSFDAHKDTLLIFVLTESYKIYVFDHLNDTYITSFTVNEANDGFNIKKIAFDENGDFIFVLTEQNIYKYSASGYFIANLQINKTTDVIYNNIRKSKNSSLVISSNHCLLKVQDVLETFKLGQGLSYRYWTADQVKVSSDEFSTDFVYNRSFIRMAQNLKSFRDNINAKFIIATENTNLEPISYFSYIPINTSDLPLLHPEVENETLGVGVNELHIPQVFNKELEKLYSSLLILKDFLDIKTITIENSNCPESFCWSWNATSCYNLSLPLIKVCNTNPITYEELSKDFPVLYAPSNKWEDAISKCCSQQ